MIDGRWRLCCSRSVDPRRQFDKGQGGRRCLALIEDREADLPLHCRQQRLLHVARCAFIRQRAFGDDSDCVSRPTTSSVLSSCEQR